MECKKETNSKHCNCTYSGCPHHGICCECISYHRDRGELPACYFPDNIEKNYDRTIECFIKYKTKGK
jgi:hypothetical protein